MLTEKLFELYTMELKLMTTTSLFYNNLFQTRCQHILMTKENGYCSYGRHYRDVRFSPFQMVFSERFIIDFIVPTNNNNQEANRPSKHYKSVFVKNASFEDIVNQEDSGYMNLILKKEQHLFLTQLAQGQFFFIQLPSETIYTKQISICG